MSPPKRENLSVLEGNRSTPKLPASSEAERLAELGGILLASADGDLRFTFVGGAWERLLGWCAKDLLGLPALELVHPRDREAAARRLEEMRRGDSAEITMEDVRLATRDGDWRWTSWNVRLEDGSYHGAGQDVTERRKAALELAASEARLVEAQRVAQVGSFEHVLATGELHFSDQLYRIYGLDPDGYEPRFDTIGERFDPEQRKRMLATNERFRSGEIDENTSEYRIVRTDGSTGEILVRASLIRDAAGNPLRVVGAVLDVTAMKKTERALAESEQRMRLLVESVPAIVYRAGPRPEDPWLYVSPQIERLLGYSVEEWRARPDLWPAILHPDDRERVLAEERASAEEGHFSAEYRVITRDGRTLWVRDEATTVRDEDGELRFQGVMLDITEAKQAQEALRAREAEYRQLVETSQDMIWAIDAENRWTFVNDAVRRIHGYEPEEMIGRPFTDFTAPDRVSRDLEMAARVRNGQTLDEYETQHVRKDGTRVDLSVNAVQVRDAEGNCIGATGTARDITERKRAAAALDAKHAQLKEIIDNSPLVIWAKGRDHRFLFSNREHEALYGLGRDEVEGMTDDQLVDDPETLRRIRERDRRVLERGEALVYEDVLPVLGAGRTFLINKFPLRDENGQVYAACGIAADITERKARERELARRVEWSDRIRSAVKEDRLELLSQPIVEVGSLRKVQEELLVRMRTVDGDLVMPSDLIPAAERYGLAASVDRWVIERAARIASSRRVEVNLSGQSLGDRELTYFIETELARAGAEPSNLVFEITETAAVEDLDSARTFAERLAALGCGFALDDFGTGFGSFTYLKHLPVSYIKIDTEFVSALTADSPDRQVVSAIVDVARNFGIETIAEGVESQEVLDLLETLGVDYAQGYHVGRPTPAQIPG